MDALDLARWQFGILTVYHVLFVPVTIGMSAIVAGYETAWVRTGNEPVGLDRVDAVVHLDARGGATHTP